MDDKEENCEQLTPEIIACQACTIGQFSFIEKASVKTCQDCEMQLCGKYLSLYCDLAHDWYIKNAQQYKMLLWENCKKLVSYLNIIDLQNILEAYEMIQKRHIQNINECFRDFCTTTFLLIQTNCYQNSRALEYNSKIMNSFQYLKSDFCYTLKNTHDACFMQIIDETLSQYINFRFDDFLVDQYISVDDFKNEVVPLMLSKASRETIDSVFEKYLTTLKWNYARQLNTVLSDPNMGFEDSDKSSIIKGFMRYWNLFLYDMYTSKLHEPMYGAWWSDVRLIPEDIDNLFEYIQINMFDIFKYLHHPIGSKILRFKFYVQDYSVKLVNDW